VPGCAARPEAIIDGVAKACEILQQKLDHERAKKRTRKVAKSNYYRNDRESNFGLLHKNTPKPAYLAISNMNVLLADAECMSAMSVHGDTSYVYRFDSSKHRNTQTLVMWSSADTDTVRLNLGIDEVTVFDVYGNAQKVKGNDGKYTFTLTDAPVYVEGDFKEVICLVDELMNDMYKLSFPILDRIKSEEVSCRMVDITGDDGFKIKLH